MEKLAASTQPSLLMEQDRPLAEALQVVFLPVTLRRPLRLFNAVLNIPVAVPTKPDSDFLLYLAYGAGHKRLFRQAAKENFKNFENFIRGKRTTDRIRTELASQLGIDEAMLNLFVQTKKHRHLAPDVVHAIEAFEGFFLRTFGTVTNGKTKCPCCGKNQLDDTAIWWGKTGLDLETDATHFVDRLLKCTLGAALLESAIFTGPGLDFGVLKTLSAPECHPIGNWMKMVRSARGLAHDWELTIVRDGSGRDFGPVPEARLSKWRSGQELIPMHHAAVMLSDPKVNTRVRHGLVVARTFALALDVVQGASRLPDPISRIRAQNAVSARLAQLTSYLVLALIQFKQATSA